MFAKVAGAAAGLMLLLAGSAYAAESSPGVSIDTPVEGATVSRSATSLLDASGTMQFAAPEQSEQRFYARYDCGDTAAEPELSVMDDGSSVGCAPLVSITPAAELGLLPTSYDFEAVDGVPFTLDATRPLTGVVTTAGYCCGLGSPAVGAGAVTVDISATAMMRQSPTGSSTRELGTTTITYTATPLQEEYDHAWQIDLPGELDQRDVEGLTLTVDVHGVNVLHGYIVSNSTFLTVPTYTASFDRTVEVALNDGAFTAHDVTLSGDRTTWDAAVPMPALGQHTLRVRATQGHDTSTVETRGFTVID